eukprot:2255410-Karenia_brevis.AAC.1
MVTDSSSFDHPNCATGATDWWAGWGWGWQVGQLDTGCKAKGWLPTTWTHTHQSDGDPPLPGGTCHRIA